MACRLSGMSDDRPAVPAPLKRALYEEAGYRCAIPTCRVPGPLELAHIEPWSQVREHRFENMIALCRNDHFRFDHSEIPRQSVRVFKSNLAVLNARYSEIERRLLEHFVEAGMDAVVTIDAGDLATLSFRNLVRDELVTVIRPPQFSSVVSVPDNPIRMTHDEQGRPRFVPGSGRFVGGYEEYRLTDAGVEFVRRWFEAETLLTT